MDDQIGYSSLLDETNTSTDNVTTNNLLVQQTEQFLNLNPNQTVTTDSQSFLTTIPYDVNVSASSIVQRDINGNINVNSINITGLTASEAVVTDASKNLASYPYSVASLGNTFCSRDSSGNGTFKQVILDGASNQIKFSLTGNDMSIFGVPLSFGRTYTLQDQFADGYILTDKNNFTITKPWTINGAWTFNADIGTNNINPNTTTTYSIGTSLLRYSTCDVATGFFDLLDSRASALSSNKDFLPSVNGSQNIGSSSKVWGNADIGVTWTPQISTRGGNLLLSSATNTIQNNGSFWMNTSSTGSLATSAFAQNLIVGQDTTLFAGNFNTDLKRTTLQSYSQVGFTGLPLVINPSGGVCVVGNYDTTAQTTSATLHVNGEVYTPYINRTTTSLAIGNTSHSTTITGNLSVSTNPSDGTINLGNTSNTLTALGNPINLNVTGTNSTNIGNSSGTTTISGPCSISTTSGAVNIGNTGSATNITGTDVNLGDSTLTTGAVNMNGFGVGIQNSTGNNHTAVIGNSGSASQNIYMYNSNIQFRNNITGASLTTLKYYEEVTGLEIAWNGPWAVGSNPSTFNQLVRIGNVCFLFLANFSVTATTSASIVSTTNVIPTRFLPASAFDMMWTVTNASSLAQGHISIDAVGSISFNVWSGVHTLTTFTNIGTAGISAGMVSWYTAQYPA